MAWVTITEAMLIKYVSGAEIDALRSAALAAGQVDPVDPTIDEITELVRGYIAACAENSMGDAGTIPERLVSHACTLILCAIITRVPGYELDDDRAQAKKDALRLLEQVADCDYAIEDPDTGEDTSGSIELVNYETRRATRTSMEGL